MNFYMVSIDVGFLIRKDLEETLRVRSDIVMFTDINHLFDAFTCGRRTKKKRINIFFAVARQSYQRYGIECIGLLQESLNPADNLTKIDGNDALVFIMETGIDVTPVEHWIHIERYQSTGSELLGGSVK